MMKIKSAKLTTTRKKHIIVIPSHKVQSIGNNAGALKQTKETDENKKKEEDEE